MLRVQPSVSALGAEASIAFLLNKTHEWLMGKSVDEEKQLLATARRDVSLCRKMYKERQQHIADLRFKKMQQNLLDAQRKDAKRLKEKETMTSEIVNYGLWQYASEVTESLASLNTAREKECALKAQLRFREKILQQVAPKPLFRFSVGGKAHSHTVLELNLKSLIEESLTIPKEEDKYLVKMIVDHTFVVNDVRKTYRGRVISQVPGHSSWYNIIYDGDDAVYSYRLRDDMANGDLIIIKSP